MSLMDHEEKSEVTPQRVTQVLMWGQPPAAVRGAKLRALALALLQRCRKRIQRQRPQQIPPHPTFNVSQSVGSQSNPLKVGGLRQSLQLASNVGIANQLRRPRLDRRQIPEQRIKRTDQLLRLLPPFRPWPV